MSTPDYKDEAVKFLSKPENLEVALDVAELVEDVKDRLVLEFWHAIKSKVSEQQSVLPGWRLQLDSDEDLVQGKYSGLDWLQDFASNRADYLRLRVERERDTIYQGVCWNKERKTAFEKLSDAIPKLGEIRNSLKELSQDYKQPTKWWVGWKYLITRPGLREKTSLLRIQAGALATEIADEFVELGRKVGRSVEEANSALALIDPALTE
jgi:hypothetical protein